MDLPREFSFSAARDAAARARLTEALLQRRYAVVPHGASALEARRGSRFALHPEGVRHVVRIAPEAQTDVWRVRIRICAFSGIGRRAHAAADAIETDLRRTLAGEPPRRPARRAAGILLAAAACVLAGGVGFLAAGARLVTRAAQDVRAGRLAWEYFPAAEPLADLPAATPWIAGAFLAGTAGLAVGVALAAVFLAGLLWAAVSEAFGATLLWCSVFLASALAVGRPPVGGGVGWARSMLDPIVLGAAALIPWAAYALFGLLSHRFRPPSAPGTLKIAALLLAAALACGAGGSAPANAKPEAGDVASVYALHRFRDRWLLSNPTGAFLCDVYYTYTPYADLMTNPSLFPDRQTLRILREAGVFLWLQTPPVGLVGLLALLAGAFRKRGRSAGPALAAAAALLVAAALPPWRAWREIEEARHAGDTTALAAALAAEQPGVRAAAAHALAAVGIPEPSTLRQGLADPDPRVRLWCATALGRAGDWPSLPSLLRLLSDDPHYLVRSHAAEAVRRFARAVPTAPFAALRTARTGLPDAPPGGDDAPHRTLAREARARLRAALAREHRAYIRRRLLLAQEAWEVAEGL